MFNIDFIKETLPLTAFSMERDSQDSHLPESISVQMNNNMWTKMLDNILNSILSGTMHDRH